MNKSFQEKELNILRQAVDKAEEQIGLNKVSGKKISEIITILENFLKKKKLVCYGGTAINNILPHKAQFYNKSIEIPDYDFFSPNALDDAKELADLYFKKGYEEVEAKSGVHEGTFKVYVYYIPVADITHMDKELFKTISKDAIKKEGILYAPVNYLRMALYLELSRPAGVVSRWEKILKRLILLNKYYPLKGEKCDKENFQRSFEGDLNEQKNIYNIVKNAFMEQGLVFFGGYANTLYSEYMPNYQKKKIKDIPDFDVLSENPLESAEFVKEKLEEAGCKKIEIIEHTGIGEIIAPHYEIRVDKDTVAFIYKPLACHSYNQININGNYIKIATIDTMLSFYLAFLYADRPYYENNRILCMAQYLFTVQAKNRLEQKGLLKRFSIKCYGKQGTLEDIRAMKNNKFKELKHNKKSKDYEFYFLRHIPSQKKITTKAKQKTKAKKKTKAKQKTKAKK